MQSSQLLTDRNFLTLWGVGALNGTGRWLDMLVIAIFVLDTTQSPFLVASMLMLRLLPMAIFGIFGGALAQRFERYHLLRLASLASTLTSLAMWALANNEALEVWHVGLASFVSGLVWSTDFPVRRTLMGEIAGPERVGRAMSLDILAGSITRMLGPLMGGILYEQIGTVGAFAVASAIYGLGLLLLFLPSERKQDSPTDALSLVSSMSAGWSTLKNSSVLSGIMGVTVVFNLWGFPFVSMVPVFGKEILELNDSATGLLVSMEGAGALLGATLLSIFARSEHSRYYFAWAVVTYCIFGFAFATAEVAWLAGALLLMVGFFSAAFGSMQSALILMNSPSGLERQMMGVLAVGIGTAPLGFLQIGMLADYFGVAMACKITAGMGLVGMIVVLLIWPGLLSRQPLRES